MQQQRGCAPKQTLSPVKSKKKYLKKDNIIFKKNNNNRKIRGVQLLCSADRVVKCSACPPSASAGKEPTCRAGDTGDSGSTPGSGRAPGEGNGNPLRYSCLGNPMDREAWRGTVRGVAETRLSNCTFWSPHAHSCTSHIQGCCQEQHLLSGTWAG